MEQGRFEESIQDATDMKCKTVSPVVEKSSSAPASALSAGISDGKYTINSLASPTPEKTIQPSRIKKKGISLPVKMVELDSIEDEAVELPDKYKSLAEFFHRIGTSVRLLNLRKKMPTFKSICIQVEVLTKRKLSYTHLGQIKYILPEAVQIEKILVHDEETLCMKPEMKVTLLLNVLEVHPDQSPYMVLNQVFSARLLSFYKDHPEGSDIPEATLPVPNSQKNMSNVPLADVESLPASTLYEPLANQSPSFGGRFSTTVPETEMVNHIASETPTPLVHLESADEVTQEEEPSLQDSESTSTESHANLIFNPKFSMSSNASESSPVKSVLDVHKVMVATPAQLTPPRRSILSSTHKVISETRVASEVKRTLNFPLSPVKCDGIASTSTIDESEQQGDKNPQTSATKKTLLLDDANMRVEDNDNCNTRQTVLKKHQVTVASLPNLFNLIRHIFQSNNYSSITKPELVYKILLKDISVVETREVEEKLDLLEELVPDWIQKKLVSSGDLLYSIKKVSDAESIRARLMEAV